MKKLIVGLSLVGLLVGCDAPKSVPAVNVEVGTIGYNKGVIYSEKFYNCSAVILDFGDEALLAHVNPSAVFDGGVSNPYNLYVDNVVDRLIQESNQRGLNISEAEAYVNASTNDFLTKITDDLESKGICVKEANIDLSDEDINHFAPRNVWFNPIEDSLFVYLRKFK